MDPDHHPNYRTPPRGIGPVESRDTIDLIRRYQWQSLTNLVNTIKGLNTAYHLSTYAISVNPVRP